MSLYTTDGYNFRCQYPDVVVMISIAYSMLSQKPRRLSHYDLLFIASAWPILEDSSSNDLAGT